MAESEYEYVLHLDKDFQPGIAPPLGSSWEQSAYAHQLLTVEQMTFAGGEERVKISGCAGPTGPGAVAGAVMITTRLSNSARIMQLLMAADAVRRLGLVPSVFIPYFPYARQDRVMTKGESLSAAVMAELINDVAFREVYIFDPHSDVTPALLGPDCRVIDNHKFIASVLKDVYKRETDGPQVALVSPDIGASKKIEKLARELKITTEIVKCDKLRDAATGKIIGQKILNPEAVQGRICLIVDDIIDGGRTFTGLADLLDDAGCHANYLAASHGIFSAGLDPLRTFEHIYCTNSFATNGEWDALTVLPVGLDG